MLRSNTMDNQSVDIILKASILSFSFCERSLNPIAEVHLKKKIRECVGALVMSESVERLLS
jgi:hypothetical protein